MIITWIDKKSVFGTGKKSYRFGDKIPSGLLSELRIEDLKKSGKISVQGEPENVVLPVKGFVKKKSKAELDKEELLKMIEEESMNTKKEPDLMSGLMGGKGAME